MAYLKHITLAHICILLTSCTLSAPQVELIISALIEDGSSDQGFDPTFMWTAQLGAQGRLVQLYEGGPDGFIFASEEGEVISFDGWVIRSLVGFDLLRPRFVYDQGDMRVYGNGDQRGGRAKCSGWSRSRIEGSIHWLQHCAGLDVVNRIVVDETGTVVSINQTIDARGNQLLLNKL